MIVTKTLVRTVDDSTFEPRYVLTVNLPAGLFSGLFWNYRIAAYADLVKREAEGAFRTCGDFDKRFNMLGEYVGDAPENVDK